MSRHMTGDNVALGVAWMVVTTFFFVCAHATAKYLVQSYPVPQVVFGRFFVHLVIAALIIGSGLYILHRERVRKVTGARPTRWG